eukprot:s1794_g17.t1
MNDQNVVTLVTEHIDIVEKVHIGIPSEPDEFIARAIEAGHPRSLDQFLDPQVEAAVRANFSSEPVDLAKKRISFFNKYLKRAQELSQAEQALRDKMPPHVRSLVGDKRLLLWKEILHDLNYPDTDLIDEIAEGFKLSGWMNRSNVLKQRTKRPSMSMETLKKLSKGLNATTLRAMSVRQEEMLESATWEETVEEEKKGWVWFDTDRTTDDSKFIGRRFGIQQSNKTRVIDDCSCCGFNWTVGLHEKFHLQSIGVLASMLAAAFKFSDKSSFPDVCGRCYDLKSAYKQFAVHSFDRYATDGKKFPFDEKFEMLGLQVDLSECAQKKVFIGHTAERREELMTRIDEILAKGTMDSKEAERLRGRMVFFEGFTFGRLANAAIKNLSRYCTEGVGPKKLDDSIKYS